MGKKQLSLIVALLICIFLPCAALAELYGWIDENGVKHFSNYPPPEGVKSFRHTLEIQSKETDADVQKNIGQHNQHSAPTPSDEDVSGKSGQGDGTPKDDNVTSDVDRSRRRAYKQREKRKQHERREERREERVNENLDRGEKHKEEKQEPGKEVKQDRQEEPVKREPQYSKPEKKKHRPKK